MIQHFKRCSSAPARGHSDRATTVETLPTCHRACLPLRFLACLPLGLALGWSPRPISQRALLLADCFAISSHDRVTLDLSEDGKIFRESTVHTTGFRHGSKPKSF